jgi:lipopolysaccharide biosynthesis regulator YciM
VVQELILWGFIVLALALLSLPFWIGKGKKKIDSRLNHYQAIANALLDKDLPRAREGFKSIIRSDTEDISAYLRLARIFREEGDRERAVALYRTLRARKIGDRQLRLQILTGLTEDLFFLKRYDEARSSADELRHLDKKHPLIWQIEMHDGLRHEDWQRTLKALDNLDRAERGYSGVKPAQVRTFIAARKSEADQTKEGIKLLEDVVRRDPNYAPAMLLLGDLQMKLEKYQKAADSWLKLIRKYPQTAILVFPRFEKAYFEMGRFGELSSVFDEMAAGFTESVPAVQLARVRLALKRGDLDEGLGLVEELLEKDPVNDQALSWRLYLLLDANRVDEARTLVKEIAENCLLAPSRLICPFCDERTELHKVRCTACRRWLPNQLKSNPNEMVV